MTLSILMLFLAAGVPYYLILEKAKINSKLIFVLSSLLLMSAIILSQYIPNEHNTVLLSISFASTVYTIYKASKTTNFYKLGYYLIFINAPFFLLFEGRGVMYSVSLLVSLLGIYLIGRFYEKNYASANYHYIRGITLSTPYIGTFLTIYLITLALYPPFPNSLYFLGYVLQVETSLAWYIVIITIFFGNFVLAMKVMRESLFGRPNANIHYVDLNLNEKLMHLGVIVLLLILSFNGLKEILL
ncbi:MAG: hypothetical protein JXQ67_07980 [Campylobacterales bacterium]|nr:hypothetical protein [Campylobacterales bacterium]